VESNFRIEVSVEARGPAREQTTACFKDVDIN
jgi:hypothetical protein